MKARLVMGVAGGSGSGKSYFLQTLMDLLPKGTMTWFSLDNYYFPIEKQEKDVNGVENFDRPESLDRNRFCTDLRYLIDGKDLKIQEYTFNHRDMKPRYLEVKAAPIIIVEGIFTLHYKEILDMLDLKVFVEAPEYLMLKRRIGRDSKERGYDLDDVLYRFEHHVIPSYRTFILPSRIEADIIVPNHDRFDHALKVIRSYLLQFVQDQ